MHCLIITQPTWCSVSWPSGIADSSVSVIIIQLYIRFSSIIYQPVNGEQKNYETRGADESITNSNIHVGQIELGSKGKISIGIQDYLNHIS